MNRKLEITVQAYTGTFYAVCLTDPRTGAIVEKLTALGEREDAESLARKMKIVSEEIEGEADGQ